MRKKLFVGTLCVFIMGVFYIGRFFFPMPLGDTTSYLWRRMRSFYCSVLYHYAYDPSFATKHIESHTTLDVVIPIVEKDIDSAEEVVKSVRAFVMHPLGKIYFVAPESSRIRELAQRLGIVFIHEDAVMPVFRKGFHKPGWIKQQYIKLNADSFVEQNHYLVIDADTIFIRPQIFILNGKTYFNVLRDYTETRKHFTREAVGTEKFYNLDFTAHHMIFEKEKLKALKTAIEEKHKKPWADALNELSTPDYWFSEYELYANFFLDKFSKKARIVHGHNVMINRTRLPYINFIAPIVAPYGKTISMHHFYK